MKNVPIPIKLCDLINGMSSEEAGKLLKRIMNYAAGGQTESESPLAEGVFSLVKPAIDRAFIASEAHRSAGKSGGRPAARKRQAKPENDPAEPQEKKETKQDIVNSYTENQRLRDAIMGFVESRKQQRKPLTLNALRLQLKELDKLSQTDEGKIAIAEQSTARGWLSFYELKQEIRPPAATPFGGNTKKDPFQILKEQMRMEGTLDD